MRWKKGNVYTVIPKNSYLQKLFMDGLTLAWEVSPTPTWPTFDTLVQVNVQAASIASQHNILSDTTPRKKIWIRPSWKSLVVTDDSTIQLLKIAAMIAPLSADVNLNARFFHEVVRHDHLRGTIEFPKIAPEHGEFRGKQYHEKVKAQN